MPRPSAGTRQIGMLLCLQPIRNKTNLTFTSPAFLRLP